MASEDKKSLIRATDRGLYCEQGGFYIDPWRPVDLAVVTHAHSDHARYGCGAYLCSTSGLELLKIRVGTQANFESLPFGERKLINGVTVSLHPAGHILGSAQVRVEYGGEVWVVSGDYNSSYPSTWGEDFVPVRCHTFITESTFGLPIYEWPNPSVVLEEIKNWWSRNQAMGRTSILPAYPLGKTQRILSGLIDAPGPIALYGNALGFIETYKAQGVRFPDFIRLNEANLDEVKGRGLVMLSSGGNAPNYFKRFQPESQGYASGWMQVRGARRNRGIDRGFILSDHSDWKGLLSAIRATGAERVGVTHGQLEPFSRYVREGLGLESFVVPTRFESGE